jgi:hypothetical protein
MMQRAFTYLGYRYAKYQFRADEDDVRDLTDFFRTAKSMLVILPVGYEEALIAGTILRDALKQHRNLQLTVIHNSTRETPLSELARCEVLRLNPGDINRFSLPKKPIMKRLADHKYDVAVNLNLDFILHTAYICKASRASVRVGCTHLASDVFYNVQVNLTTPASPHVLFKKFAECMAMF